MSYVDVEIWSHEATPQFLQVLENAANVQGLDERKGDGGGSFTISKSDPKFATYADVLGRTGLLAKRNLVRFKVDGVYRGGFIITKTGDVETEEGIDKLTYQVSGPGLRAWFRDATLYPEGGVVSKVGATTRMFSWASDAAAGSWYVPSQWVATFGQALQGYDLVYKASNGTGNPWIRQPADWPAVTNAEWIWSNDTRLTANQVAGTVYFRNTLTIATAGKYRLYCTADNKFEAYVDGIAAVDGDQWKQTFTADVDLTAGQHVFAFKVTNPVASPAGLLTALFLLNADGEPQTLISRSQGGVSSWKCCPYPANEPGWSVGQVLTKIMGEAQARGIFSFGLMTQTWTATADSNGQAWTKNLPWPLELGNDYSGFLERFEELSADVWVDPATFAVNVAQVRGIDRTGTVPGSAVAYIQPILNLTAQSDEREASYKTVALVKGQTGWVERSNPIDVAEYGRLETAVSVAEAAGNLANEIGDRTLQRAMVDTRSRPIGFVPSPGCVPFTDFGVGDLILVGRGDDGRAPESHRVASIAFEQAEDGTLQWSVELDEREATEQESLDKFLESITGGASGGSYAGVTPTIPTRTVSGNYATTPPPNPLADLRYPAAPANVATSSSSTYMTDAGTSAAKVTVTADEVTTATDTSTMTIGGYLFQIKRGTAPWQDLRTVVAVPGTSPSLIVDSLTPGSTVQFRVAAVGSNGATGAYTTGTAIAAAVDTTPPVAPIGLTVQQIGQTVTVQWGGQLTGPTSPPSDFHHLTVHVGFGAGFAMTGTTQRGQIMRPNEPIVLQGLSRGATYYLKAVAVDAAGNLSPASAEQSFTVTGIGPADVKLGSLTLELLDTPVQSALLTASRVVVGGDNLVIDPRFADAALNTARVAGTTVVAAQPTTSNPLGSLTFPATAQAVPLLTEAQAYPAAVIPGEEYAVAVDWAWVSGSPTLTVQLQVLNASGSVSTFTIGTASPTSGTAAGSIKGSAVAPAGATFARVRISQDAGGSSRVTNPRAIRKLGSTEIRDGQITTNILAANAVDGMTVTGATIRTAATGARIEQNASGIFQYNASNTVVSSWTPTAFSLTGGTISGASIYGATIGSGSFSTGIAGVGGYPIGSFSSDQAGTVNGRVRLTFQFSGVLNDRLDMTGQQLGGQSIVSIRGPRNATVNGGLSNGITGLDFSGDQLQSSFQVSRIANGDVFRSVISLRAATDSGATDYVGTFVTISAGASAATIDYPAIDVNDFNNSGYVSVRSAGFRVFDSGGTNRFEVQPAGVVNVGALQVNGVSLRLTASSNTAITYQATQLTMQSDSNVLLRSTAGRMFLATPTANYNFGSLLFRDAGDTYTSNDYGIAMNGATRLDVKIGATGLFAVTRNSDGAATFVVRANGTGGDPLFEFQGLTTSSGTANLWVTGAFNQLRKTSSLARYKLDVESWGVVDALLEIEPRTWVDRHEREQDPTYDTRFAGAIVEEVLAVSGRFGDVLEPLVTRNPDTGEAESLAYDRLAWLLLPIIRRQEERIGDLEHRLGALGSR